MDHVQYVTVLRGDFDFSNTAKAVVALHGASNGPDVSVSLGNKWFFSADVRGAIDGNEYRTGDRNRCRGVRNKACARYIAGLRR